MTTLTLRIAPLTDLRRASGSGPYDQPLLRNMRRQGAKIIARGLVLVCDHDSAMDVRPKAGLGVSLPPLAQDK